MLLLFCVWMYVLTLYSATFLNPFFLILRNMIFFLLLIPLIFPGSLPSQEFGVRGSRDPVSLVYFHIPSA